MKSFSDQPEHPSRSGGADGDRRSATADARPSAADGERPGDERIARLREIERALAARPFVPHPLFRSGHAQTLAAYSWPRRQLRRVVGSDEARLFEVEEGVRLLVHARWQAQRTQSPALVLLHGLEGSSSSHYMLGTAHRAYAAGFNVLRVNMRNCGATEHLTPTLYHSGMSGDMRAILTELVERDRLPSIFLTGFSMGGQIVLKLAGELGEAAPAELKGVCAVSPAIDLAACAARISSRSNWLYQYRFMSSLRRRIRRKKQLFPALYDTKNLRRVRTIRDFDDRYTSEHGGFADADDYYARSSAIRVAARIRTPTLIIHAEDDPIIPFSSFREEAVTSNPYIIRLTPPHGGHVGFLSATQDERERFWAESRLVEFCEMMEGSRE